MAGTVAVTGATGFIGRALVQALVKKQWQVRALTRRFRQDDESIRWIKGDLDDSDALADLVEGTFAVVHCAGAVRGRSSLQFNHTNITGTANLVRVCTRLNPQPRFLLISSLAAREPELSWYASSKRLAEQVLVDHSDAMPWTVFRPTAIYGPGDRELKPLFKLTRHGILPMVGLSNTRISLLHVDDLVAAILCWLSASVPVRGVFELDDGTPGGYDRHTLAAISQSVWGRPVRALSLPSSLVFLVATINLWLARLLRYSPMLTPGKVRELLHPDWVCDNSRLTKSLPDWWPRVSLSDALPRII